MVDTGNMYGKLTLVGQVPAVGVSRQEVRDQVACVRAQVLRYRVISRHNARKHAV